MLCTVFEVRDDVCESLPAICVYIVQPQAIVSQLMLIVQMYRHSFIYIKNGFQFAVKKSSDTQKCQRFDYRQFYCLSL